MNTFRLDIGLVHTSRYIKFVLLWEALLSESKDDQPETESMVFQRSGCPMRNDVDVLYGVRIYLQNIHPCTVYVSTFFAHIVLCFCLFVMSLLL